MKAFLQKTNSTEKNLFLIKSQIDECDFISPMYRKKMFSFCEENAINAVSEINYRSRVQYERYLITDGIKKLYPYVYAFDKVVIYHRKRKTLNFVKEPAFEYRNEELFLAYEARKDKIDMLFKMQDKKNLIWNFALICPENFKRQVAIVLSNIIESMDETGDLKLKRRHIATLKCFYEFCNNHKIYDLMHVDRHEEKRFCFYMAETHGYIKQYAQVIVNLCRTVLFLNSGEINWHANIWYMERFSIDEARINESDRIKTLSFINIENEENRYIFQDYIKYLLGLTDMSLSTIRSVKYHLEEFVIHINNTHIYKVCANDIDAYIEKQLQRGNNKDFIDRKLVEIDKWYRNLLSYEYIDKLPFEIKYFVNYKFTSKHNDRSVEEKIVKLILDNLDVCEEKVRLIFLTQLCTARRISEVCQIKVGGIKKDSGEHWICFYQPKMSEDIMVPIPEQLFFLLIKYIKDKILKTGEYVFQTTGGKAYRSGLYQKKMSKFCVEIGICEREYDFKSHDFRHTLATHMYNHGVSVQAIRDFLGHKSDEMTKQYIDFIPKEIEKKSRVLFENKAKGNGLNNG